jgi:hypothetical protein
MWAATPSSQWTCTTYSLPVSRRTHVKDFPFFPCNGSVKRDAMSIPWKALLTGFIVLAAANAAQAISIQDFFNDAVISSTAAHETDAAKVHEAAEKVRAAVLVLSKNTELLRSLQAGQLARAECIGKNFFGDNAPGAEALDSRLDGAQTTNKTADVEGYIARTIERYCPSGGGAQVSTPSGQSRFTPTLVPDFYKRIVPDNADKTTVLNAALATQVGLAKDETRGRCIDGLTVKIIDGRPNIPAAFRTDIMQELSAANRSNSSTASVEGILLNAIVKNCDNKGK